MQADNSRRRGIVEAALLEYNRTPGKFALLRREPAALFNSIRDVLQLAGGRAPDDEAAPSFDVQEAACFFVRAALLHPSADHYTLLGVERDATAEVLKDRYRLMMRLMHPDFAVPGANSIWPPDTAARVNRAYEVLSNADSREQYNASLEPKPIAKPVSAPMQASAEKIRAAAAAPAASDPRHRLRILAAVFGGGAVLLLALLLSAGGERESLVQREAATPVPSAPSTVVAASTKLAAPATAHVETAAASAIATPIVVAAQTPVAAPLAAQVQTTPVQTPTRAPLVAAPPPVIAPVAAAAPPARLPAATQGGASLMLASAIAPPATRQNVAASPAQVIAIAPSNSPATVMGAFNAVPSYVAPDPASTAQDNAPSVAVVARLNPGVTLAEVHPLLAKLVQQVETGTGERLLVLLDSDARGNPAALALVRQYNSLVDGGPVKVSQVQFRSEPLDGRLLVTGYMMIDVGAPVQQLPGKQFALQAEFASRNGAVVMTALSRAQMPASRR